jgi:hypothetical protein
MTPHPLRFALDQNFPPLLEGAIELLPEFEIKPIRNIDRRMPDLGDRELVIALHQLGWNGLITNNYKMLFQPTEVAAILRTRIVVFAVRGVGDDPVRATGAVMLDLPGAIKRIDREHRVFYVRPRNPTPGKAWDFFCESAKRRRQDPEELYRRVKVTEEELGVQVFPTEGLMTR